MGTRDIEEKRRALLRQTRTRVSGQTVTGRSGGLAVGLAELQHLAGNRTVSRMLAEGAPLSLGAASASVLLRQLSPPRAEPRPVAPALDATAEADADRVAERAMARSPRASATSSGTAWPGRIPSPLADALAPDLGDVRGVEIRSGGEAAHSADAIGALAYSQPGTVTVGSGAPALGSPEGRRLLAHEAAHAVRHGSGSDPQGRPLVHAKLAGTADALIAVQGATTTGIRKAVGARTHWDRIISKMRRYEQWETTLTDRYKKNPKGQLTPKGIDALIDMLQRVEEACNDWRAANDEAGAKALADQWHARAVSQKVVAGEDSLLQPDDTRAKAERRQAIAMLLPRVRSELASLEAGTWLLGMTLSATTFKSAGASDQGAKNKVVGQQYDTEQGSFSGFFKEDTGFDVKPVGHDLETGITQADPNYGARAVAMSRIDQLLQTNLMVRTEFATSGGKMGTVGEVAPGTRGDQLLKSFVLTTKQRNRMRKQGQPVISLEDPVLQKSLNQMQIIDAICGQLDRHAGNWFLETDKQGNVTGVKGMDLDMAFGKALMDPDGKEARKAMHYRGMPQMVDADLGQRILLLSATDIETAVKGLLGDDEVQALVSRFAIVQGKILTIQQKGGLIGEWNEQTAAAARPKGATDRDITDTQSKSYQQNLHFEALTNLKRNVRNQLDFSRTAEKDTYFSDTTNKCLDEFPDGSMASQRAKLFQAAAALVMQTLYPRVVKGDIEPGSAVDVGWQMTDALLTALGQDGKIKSDIKDKFRGEQIGKLEGIAKEKMEPLCLSAFAKRQFGATMPKRAAKTPKA